MAETSRIKKGKEGSVCVHECACVRWLISLAARTLLQCSNASVFMRRLLFILDDSSEHELQSADSTVKCTVSLRVLLIPAILCSIGRLRFEISAFFFLLAVWIVTSVEFRWIGYVFSVPVVSFFSLPLRLSFTVCLSLSLCLRDLQGGSILSFNRLFYDEHWSKHRVITCLDWSPQVASPHPLTSRSCQHLFISSHKGHLPFQLHICTLPLLF